MKHTPGPWQQHAPRIDGKIDQTYREITAWNGFYPEGFGLSGFMSEADARLIACAPELLEVLRNLVTAVTFADPPKEFNGVLCHEARVPVGFVDAARAAIAKATGDAA
jgi:hypothetical protein